MSLRPALSPQPPAQTQAWPHLENEAFLGEISFLKNDLESDHFLREHPALYFTAHGFELVKAPVWFPAPDEFCFSSFHPGFSSDTFPRPGPFILGVRLNRFHSDSHLLRF